MASIEPNVFCTLPLSAYVSSLLANEPNVVLIVQSKVSCGLLQNLMLISVAMNRHVLICGE